MCVYAHKKIPVGKSKRFSAGEVKEGFLLEKGVGEFESVVKRIIKSAEDNYQSENKEKVILFNMRLQGVLQEAKYVEKTDHEEAYWQTRECFEEITSAFFNGGGTITGITCQWVTVYRVKSGDNEGYHYYNERFKKVGLSRDYDEWTVIGWSENREQWFKSLDESLKKIIRSAKSFREASPELIENFIDSSSGGSLIDFNPGNAEKDGR